MKTIMIMFVLLLNLLQLEAAADAKKDKATEKPKETLYMCGVEIYLGMKRDAIEKSISGCSEKGSDKYNIPLWRDENIAGVIGFNESNSVISAYREWHPADDSPSEIIKTFVKAVDSLPVKERLNNTVNVYTRNEPDVDTHSVVVWFQGHKSIQLETTELRHNKKLTYVSIREYLRAQ